MFVFFKVFLYFLTLWGQKAEAVVFSYQPCSLFFQPHCLAETLGTAQRLKEFCDQVDVRYKALHWGKSPCAKIPWVFNRLSENGQPLVYLKSSSSNKNNMPSVVTLVFGGVHPDELTPVHLAFKLAESLVENPELYANFEVVVAPLVNPDGFFMTPSRRTNWNGVDLNRNFPTKDWWAQAVQAWTHKKKRSIRHWPGPAPYTEQGTRFQTELIENFAPYKPPYQVHKIVSIHAPLGWIDYDGPRADMLGKSSQSYSVVERRDIRIAQEISRYSRNYRVMNFQTYPGSLGNFAGKERQTPTVTLELDSTDPALVDVYWKRFFPGLLAAIRYR